MRAGPRPAPIGLALVAWALLGCGGPSEPADGGPTGPTAADGGSSADAPQGSRTPANVDDAGVLDANDAGADGGTAADATQATPVGHDDAAVADAPSEGGNRSAPDSGKGTTDSGATAPPYDPCPPPPEVCKIMPSGDSITVGAQSTDTGGYRVPLFQTFLADQRNATFVGPSNAGPATVDGVPFASAHDGHSGYVIDTIGTRKGLLPLMVGNLQKFTPHIVLLMIGTNDVNDQLGLPNAPARLATLLDTVLGTAPDTLLVVAQITPTRTDSLNVDVVAYNAAIPGLVSDRAKAGKHIVMVDMYGAFTATPNYQTALLFDGLHPTDAGYAVMARTWYPAFRGLLH